MEKEILTKLRNFIQKEVSLTKICEVLELSELEVMGFISELKRSGDNIQYKKKHNDIYVLNYGDNSLVDDNNYFITTMDKEIKIAVISDTRLCSKYQQLSILQDMYKKASDYGAKFFFHCGDISEGIYGANSLYNETIFLHDVHTQSAYISQVYPKIDGINTYFITGEHDLTHIKSEKIDIGKIINEKRDDMIYLGKKRKTIIFRDELNNELFKATLLHPTGKIPYTISYKPQQFIAAMRNEDKPDILFHGHWLQTENMRYRDIQEFSIPGVVATTPEMTDRGDQNTIGMWLLSVKLNYKNKIQEIVPTFLPYYKTKTNDYNNPKILRKGGNLYD